MQECEWIYIRLSGENFHFHLLLIICAGLIKMYKGSDIIKGIKLKISTFHERSNPEKYRERKEKIEIIFNLNLYTKE